MELMSSDAGGGDFNHGERAWLVIWELGLIFQLPPGVWIFYPSAIFYHFNVDKWGMHCLIIHLIFILYRVCHYRSRCGCPNSIQFRKIELW